METACGYLDDRVMWVSTDEKKLISHMLKLHKERPADVKVLCLPEENDGCLYARCPASWLKIRPPFKRNLSDEQRAMLSERMKTMNRSR